MLSKIDAWPDAFFTFTAWEMTPPAAYGAFHLTFTFVGPSNSSLIVFKDISKHFGWYISTLLYIPAVCLGAYIIFLPMHLLAKRKEKIST